MANTIAIQQYSLRNYPGGWGAAFAFAKSIGIETLEPWCGAVPNDPEAATSVSELRSTIEKSGLSLVCGHMGQGDCDAIASVQTALETGIDTFIIEVDLTPETSDAVKRDLETLRKLVL